jgi:hypothetical protein
MSSNSNQTMSAADPTGLLKRSDLENEYKVEIKQHIDRFGEVLVLKNAEGHRIMAKEKRPSTLEDCKRDVHQAFERLKLNHPHLLRMYDYSVMREDDHFIIRGYYELADANLAIELEQRKEDKAYFAAEELRNLLVDILEIVSYLKEKKMIHGDIRPEYVMFDGESQIYKLADRLGDPSPPTKVQAKNIIRGRKLYLSPQLFFNLVHQTRGTPNFEAVRLNPYLSEGYSIGLLILESGLLEECQGIYDLELGQIDEGVLQEKLALFAEQYQDQDVGLVRAVQDLLETSEEERPDLQLLLTGLKSTPQNSDNEEEPENLIFNSDRDRQGGIIEEVEEEDDQSTQQNAIHSSFRHTKVTDDQLVREENLSKGARSPASSIHKEKTQIVDQKMKHITEFPSTSDTNVIQKQSHRVEEQANILASVTQIKDSTLLESGFDLILKEDIKNINNKSDSFSYDPIRQLNSKEIIEQKVKLGQISSKESKPDSKNETKTNSISQEVHSDGHSSLKQASKEEYNQNQIFENKQNLAISRITQDTTTKEVDKNDNPLNKQANQYQQINKVEEEHDWERNLAEIKFQRDEVIQNLQSLKNLHQDFYRSEEHQQSQENKHVPNIFKEEFSSGQSLHQLTPTQHIYNKVEYESNTLEQPQHKDSVHPELKREVESHKQLSTNQTSTVISKTSSGQQLQPLLPQHDHNEVISERSRFDYKFERYVFQSDQNQITEIATNKENIIPKSQTLHNEGNVQIFKQEISEKTTIVEHRQAWESKEELIVTPNRLEMINNKQLQNHEVSKDPMNHHILERTPAQKPNQKMYEDSTQFKALEETPQAGTIKAQESRMLVDGIKRTSPFTTLKPGDILINSNQKIVPNAEFSSNISKPEFRTDSTPVRELPHPSGNTEARELSSFIASSSHETTERRVQPNFYNEGYSPMQTRYDPQMTLNFKRELYPGPQTASLTPSASQASLQRAGLPHIRELPTTKPAELQFKPAIHATPLRDFGSVHQTNTPVVYRDLSPRPQPIPSLQPGQGRVHNPIVVLSQARHDDLKPIVIRSRSTTPIKNSMLSVATVAESIAQTLTPLNGQATIMKSSQTMSTSNIGHPITQLPSEKSKELEAIFQTGPNAPAYRGFPASKSKEYYETATRLMEPEGQTAKHSQLQFTSTSGTQSHATTGYPTTVAGSQRPGPEMVSSVYLPHGATYQTAQAGSGHQQPNRSVSPLQHSLFRRAQDGSQQDHNSNWAYGSVLTNNGAYNTNQVFQSNHQTASRVVYPTTHTSVRQMTVAEQQDHNQRSRTPVGHQHVVTRQTGYDAPAQGYFAMSRQPPY